MADGASPQLQMSAASLGLSLATLLHINHSALKSTAGKTDGLDAFVEEGVASNVPPDVGTVFCSVFGLMAAFEIDESEVIVHALTNVETLLRKTKSCINATNWQLILATSVTLSLKHFCDEGK